MKKYKIKAVKWRDSRMFITQTPLEEIDEACVIDSVGYVIRETKKDLYLAGDLVDDEFRRVIVIPKENII